MFCMEWFLFNLNVEISSKDCVKNMCIFSDKKSEFSLVEKRGFDQVTPPPELKPVLLTFYYCATLTLQFWSVCMKLEIIDFFLSQITNPLNINKNLNIQVSFEPDSHQMWSPLDRSANITEFLLSNSHGYFLVFCLE